MWLNSRTAIIGLLVSLIIAFVSLFTLEAFTLETFTLETFVSKVRSIYSYNQTTPPTLQKKNSFIQHFSTFPSNEFEEALKKKDSKMLKYYTTKFISYLTKYVEMEPVIPINNTCTAPALLNSSTIDCKAYPHAFSGSNRSIPAKIAHMVQFGFDVDVLEIHLRELYDVVDYFFILESTRSQLALNRKLLTWEHIQDQERFAPFADKVIHLILDDVDVTPPGNTSFEGNGMWFLESLQETQRWKLFVEWNTKTKYFNDDDIVGFGDTDEVASRNNLQLMKHCHMSGPVDIGIWFPMSLVTQAFRTDHPAGGNEFTLGDPTFWPISSAKKAEIDGKVPSRQRGKSGKFLFGGMHLSDFRYLPFLLTKMFTCTECGANLDSFKVFSDFIKGGDIFAMESYFSTISSNRNRKRIVHVDQVKDKLKDAMVLPWFYACNKDRYGYWEGKHDLRLD